MPIDEITQKVSDRYARAASTGEQMCCPTSYDMADLQSFIPEEVLKISYGCGTPAGLKTVSTRGNRTGYRFRRRHRLLRSLPAGRPDRSCHRNRHDGHDAGYRPKECSHRRSQSWLCLPPTSSFAKGMADAIPVIDGSVDLIISNCVINLAPDKRKVFREMFRVAKPGGRFTISDIVADQPVPQYLAHDAEKWGDCLSGALTLTDYIAGMVGAGFLGIHLIKSSPWQVIDGIHFFSVTLTGYKLPAGAPVSAVRYATLRGPFSRVVDELGTTYLRGIPQPITPEAVCSEAGSVGVSLYLVLRPAMAGSSRCPMDRDLSGRRSLPLARAFRPARRTLRRSGR